MKAALLILTGLLTLSTAAMARPAAAPDLRKATALSCGSRALGYFNVADIQNENARFVSSRSNPILITNLTKDTLSYEMKATSVKYKLVFDRVTTHEDESGREHQTLAGYFVNGDIDSAIECTVHTE